MSSLIIPEPVNDEVEVESSAPACPNCVFYKMQNVLSPRMGGACHFNPPTVCALGISPPDKLGRQQPITMSFWPSVGTTDWCSKHQLGQTGKADA